MNHHRTAVASIGDEIASCAPAFLKQGSSAMRRRFKQSEPLEIRLADEAAKLRKEAQGTPPGIEREKLLRRARLAETASHMSEWLASTGLKPPT